jgi:hypothetical protein
MEQFEARFKPLALVMPLISALAGTYYFAVILPTNKRLRLQLEKERHEEQETEKNDRDDLKKEEELLHKPRQNHVLGL